MYFRNKFDEEFVYLCNNQPKCDHVVIRVGSSYHPFHLFKKFRTKDNTGSTVHIIPLLLFNEIWSDNKNDYNVDDCMMICENIDSTRVICNWNENKSNKSYGSEEEACKFNINTVTGDLDGE